MAFGRAVFLSRDVGTRIARSPRARRPAWRAALVAALVLSPGLAAATPLTKPELVKLVRKNVQERRLLAVVRELGLDFTLTGEVVEELRAAGASASLLAALRERGTGEAAREGATPTPSRPAPAPVATAISAPVAPPVAPVVAPPVASPAAPPVPVPASAPRPAVARFEPPAATPASENEGAGPAPEATVPPPAPPPRAPATPGEPVVAALPGPPPLPPPPAVLGSIPAFATPEPAGPPSAAAAGPPPPAPAPSGPGAVPAEPGDARSVAPEPPKWEIVKPMLERAQALAVEGDIRGAQALVAKAMEIDPGEPQVWKAFKGIELDLLARAETFLADGQVPRALREFQFVITTNPESALGHNGVGLALLQLKNYDEAVQAFERALALDPGNARYRQALNRARSLQRASRALEQKGRENVKEMLGAEPGRVKGP